MREAADGRARGTGAVVEATEEGTSGRFGVVEEKGGGSHHGAGTKEG